MAAHRISIFKWLGLPEPFGVVLLTLGLILTLSPYMAGADLGIFEIPSLSGETQHTLRWLGPLALLVSVILFVPLVTLRPGNVAPDPPQAPAAAGNDPKPQSSRIVFCSRCGTLAGGYSGLCVLAEAHDFRTHVGSIEDVHCTRCGVIAGAYRGLCVLAQAHNFTAGTG